MNTSAVEKKKKRKESLLLNSHTDKSCRFDVYVPQIETRAGDQCLECILLAAGAPVPHSVEREVTIGWPKRDWFRVMQYGSREGVDSGRWVCS